MRLFYSPAAAVSVFRVRCYSPAGVPVTGITSASAGLTVVLTATDLSQVSYSGANLEAMGGTVASPTAPTTGKCGLGEVGSGAYLLTVNYAQSKTNVAGVASVEISDTAGNFWRLGVVDTGATVFADLRYILGTALTETAGYIAAAFKKLFNVATPTMQADSLPTAAPPAWPANWSWSTLTQAQVTGGAYDITHWFGAKGGLPILDAGTGLILQGFGAGGITIGTVTTLTGYVAPDNTLTLTSLGTALDARYLTTTYIGRLDAAITTRGTSTYAGADTAGTTKMLTAFEQVGITGVYILTTAAFTNAPSGGLTAQQTRDALDLPATAGGPSIDTQLSAIASSIGNLGAGAFTVTITVTDASANPLQGASVRLTSNGLPLTGTTNASGVVVFAADAATYTVAITACGYQFTPTSLVVTAATSHTYAMTAVVVPVSPDPSQVTIYGQCQDPHGAAAKDIPVHVWASGTSGTGVIHDRTEFVTVSDSSGNWSAFVPAGIGMTFKVRGGTYGDITDAAGVAAGGSIQIANALGSP